MRPVKIYSQLALLCVLLMGMGFPSVISGDDAGSDTTKSKSVRYVKVGFLACSRQVSQAESIRETQEPKCVNNVDKDNNTLLNNNRPKISSKVGSSVELVAKQVQQWLHN